ncbi:MAG: VOC family protein [Sideroxyarcus sp.]|nr:VOC family protein [Sideroxyarcus sp.]
MKNQAHSSNTKPTKSKAVEMQHSPLVTVMRYRDAPAAITWLCEVFGFARHQVFANADGTIAHAELKLGAGMVMLSSNNNTGEFSKLLKQPDEVGGFSTQSSYIVVTDVDAVYARAIAARAKIEIKLQDSEEGRGFTCRDVEGHLWSVGNYNPWTQVI